MNFKRIGRMLLCLLLICALLVNVSPIRAEASAAAAAGWVLVKAAPVILSSAIGLGIVGITDSLLYDMVSHYQSEGLIDENGYMEVYSFGDGFYGVAEWVLQWLFDDFYDMQVVVDPSYVSVGSFSANETFKPYSSHSFSYYPGTNCNYYRIYFEYNNSQNKRVILAGYLLYYNKSFYTYRTDGLSSVLSAYSNSLGFYYHFASGSKIFNQSSPDINSFRSSLRGYFDVSQFYDPQTGGYDIPGVIAFLRGSDFDVVPGSGYEDMELGYVAAQGSSIADGYSDWTKNSIEVDYDDEPIWVAPIGSTAVAGNPSTSITQEDVWTGTTPIIIVIPDEGVGGDTQPSDPSEPTEPLPLPGEPVTPTLLDRLFGGVSNKIENVQNSIEEIPTKFSEFFHDLKKGIEELPSKFADWFNNIGSDLQDIRTKLQQFLDGQITLADLLSGLFEPIRTAVVDALTYLFAPSETFIKSQVEALIAKYPTSNNLFTLGTRLSDFLLNLGQKPPVIYVDLGAAEGSLLLGGTAAFLDLTWYARYKSTVDGILGAFLWLMFAWRVWLRLPGIIGGASGTIGSIMSRKEDMNDN